MSPRKLDGVALPVVLALALPIALPCRAAYADLEVGEELPVGTVAPGLTSEDDLWPVIATAPGSGIRLVTWIAGRDVRAIRVGRDGAILDPLGLSLGRVSPDFLHAPGGVAAGWDGATFVVAFVDHTAAVTLVRLNEDGVITASARLAPLDVNEVALGTGDGSSLLVWSEWSGDGADRRLGGRILAMRLAEDLAPVEGPIVVSDAGSFAGTPVVTWEEGPRTWLVAWRDWRDDRLAWVSSVYLARLSEAGELLDPGGALVADDAVYGGLAVAHDGERSMVAWTDADGGGSAVVSADGEPPQIVRIHGARFPSRLAVAWTGELYALGWTQLWSGGPEDADWHHVLLSRIAPDGAPLDDDPIEVSDAAVPEGVAVSALSSDETLLVWPFAGAAGQEGAGVAADLTSATMSADGTLREGRTLSVGPATQDVPAGDWLGDEFLLVWRERRLQSTLVAARVDARGLALQAEPTVIAEGPPAPSAPSLACAADRCLVVWQESSSQVLQVRAVLLDASGTAGSAVLVEPGSNPVVARGDAGFLIAWDSAESGPMTAFVSDDGDVASEPNDLAVGGSVSSVASNGSSFLVGTFIVPLTQSPQFDLLRVDAQGLPSGDGAAVDARTRPRIASDGKSFLVVSADTAWQASAGGEVGPAATLWAAEGSVWPDSLAWTASAGGHYLLSVSSPSAPALRLFVVDAASAPVLSGPGVTIIDEEDGWRGISAVGFGPVPERFGSSHLVSGPRSALLLYSRDDPDLGDTVRARLRAITDPRDPHCADATCDGGGPDRTDAGPDDAADAGTAEHATWGCDCRSAGDTAPRACGVPVVLLCGAALARFARRAAPGHQRRAILRKGA